MAKVDVKVPDIGDFKDVPVIEVLVKPGDVVKVDQSLITLESDKATMDVPSPVAGTVAEVRGEGRRQSVDGDAHRARRVRRGRKARRPALRQGRRAPRPPRSQRPHRQSRRAAKPAAPPAAGAVRQGRGDRHHDPRHRRLHGRAGHRDSGEGRRHGRGGAADRDARIRQGDMDVPSPAAGKITEIVVKVGDKVSMGSLIAKLDAGGAGCVDRRGSGGRGGCEGRRGRRRSARHLARRAKRSAAAAAEGGVGPARCRFLRRFRRPRGSAAGARAWPRSQPDQGDGRERPHHPRGREGGARAGRSGAAPAAGGGALPAVPQVDFAKFGPIETVPLSRIKKISGPAAACLLGQRSACHPLRRSRHHRSRRLPKELSTKTRRKTSQSLTASRCCRFSCGRRSRR